MESAPAETSQKIKGVVYKAKGEYEYSADTLTMPKPGPG